MDKHEAGELFKKLHALGVTLQWYKNSWIQSQQIIGTLAEERLTVVQLSGELECELESKEIEIAVLESKLSELAFENKELGMQLLKKDEKIKELNEKIRNLRKSSKNSNGNWASAYADFQRSKPDMGMVNRWVQQQRLVQQYGSLE